MKDYLDEYIVATRLIHRPQGTTIEELSSALGKTPRAVFDILSQLDMMFFPIYDEVDPENPRRKRYHAEKGFAEYLPDLEFTDDDKAAFNYLMDNVPNTPGMEIKLRRLFNKLKLMASERGSLIENGYRKKKKIISRPEVRTKVDFKQIQKVSSDILSIINEQKYMDLEILFLGEEETATWHGLYPVEMMVSKGDLFVFAYNKLGRLWTIPLSQIVSIKRTYEDKKPEMKVNIEQLINDPFGFDVDSDLFTVELLIDKKLAPIIESKKWPDSVSFKDGENGVIMIAKTRNINDCKVWIYQHIPYITILKPIWLKEDIMDGCCKMLNNYNRNIHH